MFLNHLYGGMDEPELKIIDVFVCKLRKKLAQATGGSHYIETVWGRGYVLARPGRSASCSTPGPGLADSARAARLRCSLAREGDRTQPNPAGVCPYAISRASGPWQAGRRNRAEPCGR